MAIEEDHFMWICCSKKSLCSKLYKGLMDAILKGDTNAKEVGKKIILPSSNIGSPRLLLFSQFFPSFCPLLSLAWLSVSSRKFGKKLLLFTHYVFSFVYSLFIIIILFLKKN